MGYDVALYSLVAYGAYFAQVLDTLTADGDLVAQAHTQASADMGGIGGGDSEGFIKNIFTLHKKSRHNAPPTANVNKNLYEKVFYKFSIT